MRFGFAHIPREHFSRHVRLVKLAEDLGFDYAWVPDQTFFRDPYVMLAACALATSSIRLGVGVTNPYTRHPAVAARAVATVDEMSGGRALLGVGAGNNKELLEPLNIEQGQVGARCREMLLLVRDMLSGGAVDFEGTQFRVKGARLEFGARRDIPLYLAGRGPMILKAGGELADGVIIGGLCSENGLRFAFDMISRGAAAAGRDLASIDVVSWVTVNLTDDRPAVLDRLRPTVAHLIGGAPEPVLDALGFDPGRVAELKARYRRGGPSAAAGMVTDEMIDSFCIVGTPDECSARIDALRRWGATQFCVLMPPGTTDDYAELITRFAREIMPNFR